MNCPHGRHYLTYPPRATFASGCPLARLGLGILALVITLKVGVMVGAALGGPARNYRGPTQTSVIQEDDPRWDCRTMGNRICGPGH